jgi:hypothetical protein
MKPVKAGMAVTESYKCLTYVQAMSRTLDMLLFSLAVPSYKV